MSAKPVDARPLTMVGDGPNIRPPGGRRLLVLKLDHRGDFIIGRPALESLRRAFPHDHIRLICGAWNLETARASGLADEVRGYDYFPEQADGWDGRPLQDLSVFDAAAEGSFDIAIDLRVNEDTRDLLKRVDATLKCGIGPRARFDFLDIILRPQPRFRDGLDLEHKTDMRLGPNRFQSRMTRQNIFEHVTRARFTRGFMIFGPYIHLPTGRYRATFGLHGDGLHGWPAVRLRVEVARHNQVIASAVVSRSDILSKDYNPPQLEFDNVDADDELEFRVHRSGWSLFGSLRFTGVRLDQLNLEPTALRNAVDLHIGEELSLLVELVRQRTGFSAPGHAPAVAEPSAIVKQVAALPAGQKIVLAPMSNSTLRDWPIENYARLAGLLGQDVSRHIILLGSAAQADTIGQIIRRNAPNDRILDLSGRTTWDDLTQIIGLADLVICNNSGVAHLAADIGARTLAIYSASHPPREWGARGPNARILMAATPCSPCGHDRIEACPYEHRCMTLIEPEIVSTHAEDLLRRSPPPAESH